MIGDPCQDQWEGITCSKDGPYVSHYEYTVVSQSLSAIFMTITNKRLTTDHLVLDATQVTGIGGRGDTSSRELMFNRMVGTLPTQLGVLARLTSLGLFGNYISGTIPTQLGSIQGGGNGDHQTISLVLG